MLMTARIEGVGGTQSKKFTYLVRKNHAKKRKWEETKRGETAERIYIEIPWSEEKDRRDWERRRKK